MAPRKTKVTPTATGESVAKVEPTAVVKVEQAPAPAPISEAPTEPASVCKCGHTGDGPNSQHNNTTEAGHGMCLVDGCECMGFTWDHFTEKHASKGGKPTTASVKANAEAVKKVLAANAAKAPGKETVVADPGPAVAMAKVAPVKALKSPVIRKVVHSDAEIDAIRAQGYAAKVVAEDGNGGKTVELTKNGVVHTPVVKAPVKTAPAIPPELAAKVEEARKLLEQVGVMKPKTAGAPRVPKVEEPIYDLIKDSDTAYHVKARLTDGTMFTVFFEKRAGKVTITPDAVAKVMSVKDCHRTAEAFHYAGVAAKNLEAGKQVVWENHRVVAPATATA
jgi:hypothetical protein